MSLSQSSMSANRVSYSSFGMIVYGEPESTKMFTAVPCICTMHCGHLMFGCAFVLSSLTLSTLFCDSLCDCSTTCTSVPFVNHIFSKYPILLHFLHFCCMLRIVDSSLCVVWNHICNTSYHAIYHTLALCFDCFINKYMPVQPILY